MCCVVWRSSKCVVRKKTGTNGNFYDTLICLYPMLLLLDLCPNETDFYVMKCCKVLILDVVLLGLVTRYEMAQKMGKSKKPALPVSVILFVTTFKQINLDKC